MLSYAKTMDENTKGVLYWMSREQRIQGISAIIFSLYEFICLLTDRCFYRQLGLIICSEIGTKK